MRSGMLPSHQRALRRAFKKADKFDHFRARTRRSFVLGGLVAAVATAGAFWAGVRVGASGVPLGDPVVDRWRKKLPWAEEFAAMPVELIAKSRSTFLTVIEQTGGTDATWRGFSRLAQYAMEQGDRELASRLLEVIRLAPPPDAMHEVVEALNRLR